MSAKAITSIELWKKLGFDISEVVSCDIHMSVGELVTIRVCKRMSPGEASKMIKAFEHYRLEPKPFMASPDVEESETNKSKTNCDYKFEYEKLLKQISEIEAEAMNTIETITDEEIYWQSVGKLHTTEKLMKT